MNNDIYNIINHTVAGYIICPLGSVTSVISQNSLKYLLHADDTHLRESITIYISLNSTNSVYSWIIILPPLSLSCSPGGSWQNNLLRDDALDPTILRTQLIFFIIGTFSDFVILEVSLATDLRPYPNHLICKLIAIWISPMILIMSFSDQINSASKSCKF